MSMYMSGTSKFVMVIVGLESGRLNCRFLSKTLLI